MNKLLQSTNTTIFAPPVDHDSDLKNIFLKYVFDSNDFMEKKGKFYFIIYFSNGFPGGNIEIKNSSTGEVLNLYGYNNNSGIFEFDLDDIEFTLKYYINNEEKILTKKFFFKNSLNFNNSIFRNDFITKELKPLIYDGYLKIAYNKSVKDFDAHIYFNDDNINDLNVACYSYDKFDINSYDQKNKDFIFKMKYNDNRLGLLINVYCNTLAWRGKTKAATINNPKIYYDLFFFYKKLRENFIQNKSYDGPFRLHYINPIIQYNSLIIDYYD